MTLAGRDNARAPIVFIDDAHTFGGAQIALAWAIRVVLRNTEERIICVTVARTRAAIQDIAGDDPRLEFVECSPALPLNIVSFPLRLVGFFRILLRLRRRGVRAWWLNLSGIEFCLAPLVVLKALGGAPVGWLHNTERFAFFAKRSTWMRRTISLARDRIADRWLFGLYPWIITPSRCSATEMLDRVRGPKRPQAGHLYYPTIRAEAKSGPTLDPRDTVEERPSLDLWMIGRVDLGHKNNLAALDAIKVLADRGKAARLTVVGDGPDLDEFKVNAGKLGPTAAVEYLGWRDDPWRTVPKNAIVFIPSFYESMSIVAREAMIRGLRLAASPIPVFREWIPHRLIAEDFRAESFADKILEVQALDDVELHALYDTALARFSDEIFAGSFMAYTNGKSQQDVRAASSASVSRR